MSLTLTHLFSIKHFQNFLFSKLNNIPNIQSIINPPFRLKMILYPKFNIPLYFYSREQNFPCLKIFQGLRIRSYKICRFFISRQSLQFIIKFLGIILIKSFIKRIQNGFLIITSKLLLDKVKIIKSSINGQSYFVDNFFPGQFFLPECWNYILFINYCYKIHQIKVRIDQKFLNPLRSLLH